MSTALKIFAYLFEGERWFYKVYNKLSIYLIFFGLLLAFWMVLASKVDWQTFFVGAVVSAVILFYNRDIISTKTARLKIRFKHIFNLAVLIPVLLIEILKANVNVALIVLSSKLPITPCVTTVKTNIKSSFLKVLLSNCITLTPGTLTLENNDEEILVHCLTKEAKEGLKDWKIHKIISRFEEA